MFAIGSRIRSCSVALDAGPVRRRKIQFSTSGPDYWARVHFELSKTMQLNFTLAKEEEEENLEVTLIILGSIF